MAKKNKKKTSFRTKFTMIFLIAMGVIFSSTAVILLIGMLPTIVAVIIDNSKEKLKPLTVGAMNLAGCFPFVLESWVSGSNDISVALDTVLEPRTFSIIYMAAAIGYLIDWSLSGIVAQIMVQKGRARLKEIDRIQESLIERWGPEVKGEMQLDEYGFPIDQEGAEALETAHESAKAQ
ncbi:MAG: hypothetical protein AAF569_00750 [Pseudomonadota bacterium]